MDEGIAFFHLILNEENQIQAAIIEDCNKHYLEVSEAYGIPKDQIIHHNYYEIAGNPDPRWNYYIYQAAVLRKHVHGGFRNSDFGSWMEFSGGPAEEENTCWMMFIDHTKFQDENERLLKERNIDALTGVNNRNAYEDVLETYRKSSDPLGIIMVDINGLKETNDNKGHLEGDRMIENMASFLCTITHRSLPYRIGGDEFVLLIENCTEDKMTEYLEKIHKGSKVSVSCGAAWCEHAFQIDDGLKRADKQMYKDKRKYYQHHERKHVR